MWAEGQTGGVVRVWGRENGAVDLLKHEEKYWLNISGYDVHEVKGLSL